MAASKPSKFNVVEGLSINKVAHALEELANNVQPKDKAPDKAEKPAPEPAKELENKPVHENVEITVKRGIGRPKAVGEFQNISVRLTKENYIKARTKSGIYGGVTAYINHLIEIAD